MAGDGRRQAKENPARRPGDVLPSLPIQTWY